MIKEGKQCSSKSLSRSYLASKFAKQHVYMNHKIAELLKPLYKLINFHSFVKFAVVIENKSHLTRIMKLTSICQNMFKKYQTYFGQFANILPGCYLLDTVCDSVR